MRTGRSRVTIAGQVAALDRQHVQAVQLARELRLVRREAAIERDLLRERRRAAVEAGLRADEVRAAARVDRRDQADVGDAVAQLGHRVLGGQQRAGPERLDPQRAARFAPRPTCIQVMIGAAERMRRAHRGWRR